MHALTRKRSLGIIVAAGVLGAVAVGWAVADPTAPGGQASNEAAKAAKASAFAAAHPSDKDKTLAAEKAGKADHADSGGGNLLQHANAVVTLADHLHVSRAAAKQALAALVPLSEAKGGLDPTTADFNAVASRLGVSSAQLVQALDALKAGR